MSTWTPMTLHRVTNGHARPVLCESDVSAAERAYLDYVDWEAVENGHDSFTGFRYRGRLYDLSEFEASRGTLASDYDGWQPESAFSAVAIKYADNYESVVVTYLHW